MRSMPKLLPLVGAATILVACGAGESPGSAEMADGQAAAQSPAPPYKPVASILDLMRSAVTFSAETYWESVMIVWDANGETIHQPEDDLEWQEIWGAAMTLAESGNLLMMPPRAIEEDEWYRLSTALVDAGVEAAAAAAAKDYMAVLEMGNHVYNACVDCHEIYVPTLPDL